MSKTKRAPQAGEVATTAPNPDLLELIERLGITEDWAGMPIYELIAAAAATDDPTGFLSIHAPQPEEGEGEGRGARDEGRGARDEGRGARDEGRGARGEGREARGEGREDLTPAAARQPVALSRVVAPLADPPADPSGREIPWPRPRHVEVGALSLDEAVTLYRLREGLRAEHATLANGRFIQSNADAMRWLLQQAGG
jgi:hypothetical protein